MPRHRDVDTPTMKAAMAARWKAPQDALVWEVGDATGGRHTRAADAVIMGLWPSRGIDLDGVEIKTYRSDWLRELKNPAKADPVARFCDHWWIHAAVDVVKVEELPPGWGLRIYDGRIWMTPVEAARRVPEPIDRHFLASLLRRSDQQNEKAVKAAAEAMLDRERAAIDRRVEDMVQQRTRRASAMASIAEEFEKVLGLSPEEMIRNGEVAIAANMVAALLRQDLHNPYSGLPYLIKSLRDVADGASAALAEMGVEPPDEAARAMRMGGTRRPAPSGRTR